LRLSVQEIVEQTGLWIPAQIHGLAGELRESVADSLAGALIIDAKDPTLVFNVRERIADYSAHNFSQLTQELSDESAHMLGRLEVLPDCVHAEHRAVHQWLNPKDNVYRGNSPSRGSQDGRLDTLEEDPLTVFTLLW
jgi:hypothetical protein